MSFELPKLPYAYDALSPHIDARTMEIHHSKHHQGYTNNLNTAIAGTNMEGKSIEEILQLTPITGILFLLACRKILFSSEDSPETLNIKIASLFFCIVPKPPCCKSFAENAALGVPKLDNVAETLRPTR